MFWKRMIKETKPKAELEIVTKPEAVPTPPTSTLTLVKEKTIPIIEYSDSEIEHLYAHQAIVGADEADPIGYFYPNFVEELFDAGFTCFVKADFVSKFKYCASLGNISIGSPVCENPNLKHLTRVDYIGDIPSTVISRINEADKLLSLFTIHSHEPLKIGRLQKNRPYSYRLV